MKSIKGLVLLFPLLFTFNSCNTHSIQEIDFGSEIDFSSAYTFALEHFPSLRDPSHFLVPKTICSEWDFKESVGVHAIYEITNKIVPIAICNPTSFVSSVNGYQKNLKPITKYLSIEKMQVVSDIFHEFENQDEYAFYLNDNLLTIKWIDGEYHETFETYDGNLFGFKTYYKEVYKQLTVNEETINGSVKVAFEY